MKLPLRLGLLIALFAPVSYASPRHAPARRTPVAASHAPTVAPPPPAPPVALPTPPAQPQPSPAICCCRAWSHGWQYTWRPAAACTAENGSCVSPDHC